MRSGHSPGTRFYLEEPPSAGEVMALARALGVPLVDLVRSTEREAIERSGLVVEDATDGQVAVAIANHPILLQRPILVYGDAGVLGRPPERVLEWLRQRSMGAEVPVSADVEVL